MRYFRHGVHIPTVLPQCDTNGTIYILRQHLFINHFNFKWQNSKYYFAIHFLMRHAKCFLSLKIQLYIIMRVYASSMYNRLFIFLIQVRYLGIDVSPTSLPQWPILLFLLIFITFKHITWNSIYYHYNTFSLMIYNFIIMYTAWCLTLYLNPIYCWSLSIYNYFNLLPITL